MEIHCIQTARKGSKSVKNKNKLIVNGKPCYRHNIDYCKESKFVNEIFISTDDEDIMKSKDCYIIQRPKELSGDTASHKDVIIHALETIESTISKKVDMLVVILGNNVSCKTEDLDSAIQSLIDSPSYDSVQSVSKYNMFNPYRALRISDGKLEPEVEKNINFKNDKNSYGNFYFFNGSFWVIRRDSSFKENQTPPFEWLGEKIMPFVQEEGVMEIDANWQTNIVGLY